MKVLKVRKIISKDFLEQSINYIKIKVMLKIHHITLYDAIEKRQILLYNVISSKQETNNTKYVISEIKQKEQ